MSNTTKILGTTADYKGCDCCGRENLKKYVVIRHADGDIGHYGTSCAATMLDADAADIAREAKAADKAAAARAARDARAASRAAAEAWEAWLAANGTGTGTLELVKSLGGFAAAKAAYAAR